MRDGYRVIDCDLHVMEPLDLWERFSDDRFKHRMPVVGSVRGGRRLIPQEFRDGARVRASLQPRDQANRMRKARDDKRYERARAARFDPASQLEAMDREGIDIGVLFHTLQLTVTAYDGIDPELAGGICRAANRWLAEFAMSDSGRLKATGHIPLHRVDESVCEARYAIEELGVLAVVSTSHPCEGRPLHDSYYEPLWELLEECEVPLCLHGMSINGSQVHISQRYPDIHALQHGAAHPIEMMLAVGSLTLGGVFERHPKLRVGCFEATCGWLPWWLARLDQEYEQFGDNLEQAKPSAPPSEHFKGHGIIACDADEDHLDHFIERLGEEHLAVSTDYPHDDSLYPVAIETFLKTNEQLPVEAKRKILWDNPCRFYGLD